VRRERIASVVTALALVLAAVGGGLGPLSATSTASAEWKDCDLSNGAFIVPAAAYNTVMGVDGCRWESGSQAEYDNITATDAYANAAGISDSVDSYTTQTDNFQQDARSVAYTKAKIEVVRALENGTSESQAQLRANQTVADYYAQMQLNILKDYNAKLTQISYLANTSLGAPTDWKRVGQGIANTTDTAVATGTYPLTLANGTTFPVKTINAPASAEVWDTPYYFSDNTGQWDLVYQSPGGGDHVSVMQVDRYWDLFKAADVQAHQVGQNIDPYVTEVYSQYETGQLNATDIVRNDPTLLAEQASTNYNSTGYYGYAAVQLASIGAAGDVNASHVISVDGGSNFTGTLFYTGEDRETFQTGETYQFSNLNGSVYLAASDGPNNASGIVYLNEKGSNFTIVEATNTQTGESVNKTVTQKYVYESANATALQSEIDRLEELRNRYEEQAAANSGVGINLGTEDKAIIGVIAAVVLVLALRD
jgi:hypothetical protein